MALRRGEALGDIDDKAAKDFQKQIDDLERKVKGKEATSSAFDKLREGAASLLNKQAQTENPGYGIQAVGIRAQGDAGVPRALLSSIPSDGAVATCRS